MPTYDYRCEESGEMFEVVHKMNDVIQNWGDLCERLGMEPGEISKESPVSKLATGGQVVKQSSLGEPALPPCASGGCNPSACGMN